MKGNMKRILALLLAAMMLLSLAACGGKLEEDGYTHKYTYYPNGNIKSDTAYNDNKECVWYIEYTYHENDNIKTMEFYGEKGGAKLSYCVYDEQENIMLIENYKNNSSDISSSTEYGYDENGKVLSMISYTAGVTYAEYYGDRFGMDFGEDGAEYLTNPSWTHTEYYDNGSQKEVVTYELIDGEKVLCSRTEYQMIPNFEEYIYAYSMPSSGSTTIVIGPTLDSDGGKI